MLCLLVDEPLWDEVVSDLVTLSLCKGAVCNCDTAADSEGALDS